MGDKSRGQPFAYLSVVAMCAAFAGSRLCQLSCGSLNPLVATPLCLAGIGENSAPMRREMTRDMEFAGVVLDEAKNVKVCWRACDLHFLLIWAHC